MCSFGKKKWRWRFFERNFRLFSSEKKSCCARNLKAALFCFYRGARTTRKNAIDSREVRIPERDFATFGAISRSRESFHRARVFWARTFRKKKRRYTYSWSRQIFTLPFFLALFFCRERETRAWREGGVDLCFLSLSLFLRARASASFSLSLFTLSLSFERAEWSITYCRPSRRDINVVVTIGFIIFTNGWLQRKKERERLRERVLMIIAVMTNRLTQLALSLGFEEDLFQTHTTFLTEQYLRDAARALFSLSLILSLFRARVLAKALFLCRLFTHPCSSSIVIIDDRSLKKKVHI